MDTQQLERSLIDELFDRLTQQAQPEPLQLPTPQDNRPCPYMREPSPEKIERRQRREIEDQLRALVETSTARLYEMLARRLDEMKAEQVEANRQRLEAEQQRWILDVVTTPRVSPPCTPSRDNSLY